MVNTDLMFDCAAKELSFRPLWDDKFKVTSIYDFDKKVMTCSPKSLKKQYTKGILSRYLGVTNPDKYGLSPLKDKRIRAELTKCANKAFRYVSGHTWSTASRLKIGKYSNFINKDKLKFYNYMKCCKILSNHFDSLSAIDNLRANSLDSLKKESEPLLFISIHYGISSNEDTYKELKNYLCRRHGFTKGDWKFLCKQTKSWVTTSIRTTGIVTGVKLRLRQAHMKNPFIMTLSDKRYILENKKVMNIFKSTIHNYEGYISRFGLFPVVKDVYRWSCRELDIINDYLYRNNTNRTTIHGLYEDAMVWHEQVSRRQRGEKIDFSYKSSPVYKINGVEFELITDSDRLHKEGQEMKHCVFSYRQRCYENEYMVFHANNGVEKATLGISLTEESPFEYRYSFNQMYGPCNSTVSDEMKKAATKLIYKLNKEVSENNEKI